MKKLLLAIFTLLCAVSVVDVQAQACEPDPTYVNEGAGVYPLPDSVGSSTSALPSGIVGEAYEAVFTAVVPDSLTVSLTPGSDPLSVDLVSVKVDSITGLPPGIDQVLCEPLEDCLYVDQSVGCLVFSGTPTTEGIYYPTVYATANIGFPLQVTFPGALFPGEYKIEIVSVGLDDDFAAVVGVSQNVPNPFNNTTIITVDTKEAGNFDFKVYSLLGEMVHSEVRTFTNGQNTIEFNGSHLESGMYFYTIGQGNALVTKRMVVSK